MIKNKMTRNALVCFVVYLCISVLIGTKKVNIKKIQECVYEFSSPLKILVKI